MPETISLTEEQKKQGNDAVNKRVSVHTVGFVKLSRQGRVERTQLCGTGTLVQAGGKFGILTADHALKALPRKGEIGLVLCARIRTEGARFNISADHAKFISIGENPEGKQEGPDLGLLILSPADASRLQAEQAFYDLERRRDKLLAREVAPGFWTVNGIIAEWKKEGPHARFAGVDLIKGLCLLGGVRNPKTRGQFDFIDFEVDCTPPSVLPNSFEGISGGGLWESTGQIVDDKFVINDVLLSGVIFFQTAINEDNWRFLVCHGRRSIYNHAIKALLAQ